MSDRTGGDAGPSADSDITAVVLPLSKAVLQWRAGDGAYRVLLAGGGESSWQTSGGGGDLHIVADGEVWRRASCLVGWGEVPPGGKVDVLRTDETPVRVLIAGRAWICEWIGYGEPVTVAYDNGIALPVASATSRLLPAHT